MKFDLAIIGGGPAGYSAAFEGIKNGLTVVLFEYNEVGGTCLNRGCVPTKYLSHIAYQYNSFLNSYSEGLYIDGINIDYSAACQRMNEIVSNQRYGLTEELNTKGVILVSGNATIEDPNTVSCKGDIYHTKYILISTGSVPAKPLLYNAITSDELLEYKTIPPKLYILGGGSIAIEFANIFNKFGSEVDIYIRGERILRKWDKEIATSITQIFKKRGINVYKNTDFTKFEITDGVVLSANGRIPRLPQAKVKLFDVAVDGGIIVDENGKTRSNTIYAAGDVITNSDQLAHVAMEQGRRAVRNIVGLKNDKNPAVVKCIYLDQEVASVGLDEKTAKDSGIDFSVGKASMYSNARSLISKVDRGFVKILAEKGSGQIIGAQLLCDRAGEIVAELALGINHKMTLSDMLRSVRPHPSFCEVVTDALRILEGKVIV